VKNKKSLVTTVIIASFVAMAINFIMPDVYQLVYFNQIGQKQLFTYAVLGFCVVLIFTLILKARERKK